MNTTRKTIAGIFAGATLVTGALTGLAATAEAAPKAPVTVTIKAQGTDMSGEVKSSKPGLCANNRTVKVFIVLEDGPDLFASDTTGKQGNKYVWSTGNTGTEGQFFAKVNAKPGCKADVSPTITVSRPDDENVDDNI
jgi:hypothetical protein